MLDFLIDLGVKKETISGIENKLFDGFLYSLNCNEFEIEKIIKYFNDIGIKCIDEILLEDTDLFLNSFKAIKDKFEKYDIKRLVEAINNDYEVIFQI